MHKIKKIKMPTEFSDEPKGLVIAYIGAGKGKTTAVMGLAARASGAGMNVYILQFVKAQPSENQRKEEGEWPISSEIEFFNFFHKLYHPKLSNLSRPFGAPSPSFGEGNKVGAIETEQVGLGFVGILGDKKQKETHMRQALKGLERAREILTSGEYQLVILDELISALELKLIEERDILDLINLKPKDVHLAMTGHNKFPVIIKVCDLVTEMKMVKHPYYKGILAQRGIDY
jgi:cob(I)alamin adenosyltransferase